MRTRANGVVAPILSICRFDGRAAAIMLRGLLTLAISTIFLCGVSIAQPRYEGRNVTAITIEFDNNDSSPSAAERYRIIADNSVGTQYSAVRVRDSLAALYDTGEIERIIVEATEIPPDSVALRYLVRRKTVARRVAIEIAPGAENVVSEEELLLRLDLLDPGAVIDERSLQSNADLIVAYLRDRGFYRAAATYEQRPQQSPTEVDVVFRIIPGAQATVQEFDVDITGFDASAIVREVGLTVGSPFSKAALDRSVEKIREALRKEDFLAPTLEEPRVVYDSATNSISVSITGRTGPAIEVVVDAEADRVGSSTQRRLLPILRDGTLDYAAIIEGERRLENHFQERGYFFVNVTAVCSVDPPLTEDGSTIITNDTEFLCSALNSAELAGRKVTVKYRAELDRKLKLVDMRLRGTNQFTITEIKPVLETKEANVLGAIPFIGFGRGYTSARLLEEDAATIRSLLRELGYRQAEVRVNRGVSLDGNDLIITFEVEEGRPTVVSEVEIRGNNAFSDAALRAELPSIAGRNFSRALVRTGQQRLAALYSNAGYYDADIEFIIDELPPDPDALQNVFRVIYNIKNEGKPVYVNRILIAGNERTKESAIRRALTLGPDELLKAADIYTSEQNLYSSDAFERVSIKPQPAGDRADGGRSSDVIVEVQEQPPRLLQYGGGFSTDVGLSGFVDLRHFNLLGNLWQGGARIRWSQRQQIVGFDFVNPRFIREAKNRFAPLTISAQYQRDSTVTRFFRSAFDTGTFGIVQRVDEEGNPIDDFGNPTGDPTINRLTLLAETNRTISLKDRSVLFVRYRFEDVRLFNIESLLIKDLLVPDSRIRISGFGATFVRDTRRRCGIEYSILDIIARGEAGEPCRYNASDPTDGNYFTAEYNVSVPALGANIGFHKFQAAFNYYYTFPKLKNTTIAARGLLGLASVFHNGDRFDPNLYPGLEGILPISERFFAGGANTLRGFDFESAGPRVVIVPQGEFRNSQGEPVMLDPFTVPFGGNALAVVNVEARVPLSASIRGVTFYDGGNVFTRVKDIFRTPADFANDVVRQNLNARWTHTVGVGLRIKTPIGGEFGIDYGYLLNPPSFVIPQGNNPPAFYRLPQGQIHFRFSQAF
jgi:outer membrane protein insertion porin family